MKPIAVPQGEQFLEADLNECCRDIAACVTVNVTQGQMDALISFVFNLGGGALASSTLLHELNGGNLAAAADQFPLWVHGANKQVLPGLVARRAWERTQFLM